MTDDEWDRLMGMVAIERKAWDDDFVTGELWMVLDMVIEEAQRLRAEAARKTYPLTDEPDLTE